MLIIGLAGHPSSGKDTAGRYLEQKGFFHISCGDLLRDEMKKLGLPIDRPSVREFVTEKRQELGAQYPVDIASQFIKDKTVISGFRNLAEINHLKDKYNDDFTLIGIEAPLKVRYQRALDRNREGDAISFEDFQKHEEAERNAHPESHELDNVLAQADISIVNDGTQEDLYRKIEDTLSTLQ